MLNPSFQLNLHNSIQEGQAVVGKYDGTHPSLTCATSGGKIFMHNPHHASRSTDSSTTSSSSLSGQSLTFLNVNKPVTAMCCGAANPSSANEVLFVGMGSSLMAYDVERNQDLFFKEVPDGSTALTFGSVSNRPTPLAISGGNCTVQGFNHAGKEDFWTVTGGNVGALCLVPSAESPENELVVGSDDYMVRIFEGEDVVVESMETDKIIDFCHIHDTCFGFSLANGTIGVYGDRKRRWRVKSKSMAVSVASFDLDGDGVPELISGWRSGKFEARRLTTGEVVHKDHFARPVAKILAADYRSDGNPQIICCSTDGQVRGFLRMTSEQAEIRENAVSEENLRELAQKKQEMLFELKNYEDNLRKLKEGSVHAGLVPPDTNINVYLLGDPASKHLMAVMECSTDSVVIHAAALFAESLFQGESVFSCPKNPTSTLHVPIVPERDAACTMFIQALVGPPLGKQLHVFELTLRVQRFCSFSFVPPGRLPKPSSHVRFQLKESTKRVFGWLDRSFIVPSNVEGAPTVDVTLQSIKTGEVIHFLFVDGWMTFSVASLSTAADIVQDLCMYFSIQELESDADFPEEFARLEEILATVSEYNAVRLKMNADMADSSQVIKTLVVKAEDARLLGDMKLMQQMYTDLRDLNGDLLREYRIRENNHKELLKHLKSINHFIQQASKLRNGEHKARVVAESRKAVKANDTSALFSILRTGRRN